jgi:hypothetical protein
MLQSREEDVAAAIRRTRDLDLVGRSTDDGSHRRIDHSDPTTSDSGGRPDRDS